MSPTAIQSIWLTGSRGFIGGHLVAALRHVCPQLVCLTSSAPAHAVGKDIYFQYLNHSSRSEIQNALQKLGVPEVFIHLGWGAMTDPGSSEHLERNVSVSQTLIDTLFESGLSTFIFIGSINEYGSRSGCLTEDLPPEGRLTNYARGKAIVTSYGLEQSSRYGKTFISARLSYTYGPGQRSGSLLNKLYRCYHERVAPNLGPCEHFRDYIYVGEVAEGIKRLCGIQTSAIVNLGSGRCIQVKDLVQRFWVELGGLPDQLHFGASPMREGEPDQPYSYVSLEKLQELACWSPVLTIDEGVRLTIQSLDRERTAGQS